MIQTTMKDLTKERLMIRNTNPVRANVLLMLVNAVKQMTIDERRPEAPQDFAKAAKKMYAEIQNTIPEYQKGHADTSELEQELKELEPFLPQTLSQEETEKAVKELIDSLPEDQRVLKNIMPKLKSIESIDMKIAKAAVHKILNGSL